MLLKIKAELIGIHYNVSFWMGAHEEALGKCGTLVFLKEEWMAYRASIFPPKDTDIIQRGPSGTTISVTFMEDLQIIITEKI